MVEDKPLPNKLDVARALMLKGSLFLHLDPRVEDVMVPPWFKRQPQLVLQVGLDMPVPIADLRVDEQGVQATLSFNRTPFLCVVPWASVFALVGDDGRGMVWPESMPVEIAAEVDREHKRHGSPRAPGVNGGTTEAAGGKVERIVGRAVRELASEPKQPRIARAPAKLTQSTLGRLPRAKRKAPDLQLIRGESERPRDDRRDGGAARVRQDNSSAASPRRPPHLRVVK